MTSKMMLAQAAMTTMLPVRDYDLPGFRTVEHVCVLGSEKAAWFSDPQGNILCIHEHIV